MANVVYSIYIEISKQDYDTNVGCYYYDEAVSITKSERSHIEYERYKDQLSFSKQMYCDEIGVDYIQFGLDDDFISFENKMKAIEPSFTKYEIINFYKFDRAEYLSKKYDNILFLDFDVVPNNFNNFFEWYNPSKIAVQDSPLRVDIVKDVINGPWDMDARAPEAKRYNCSLLLDYYGIQNFDGRAWNTAVMGFSAKTLSELNYFEQMNNVIHAMKEIKDEPRKEQLKKLLGFDNETLFGFRLAHNEIKYTILPEQWHYIVDDIKIKKITNEITFCHLIDKQFRRFFNEY